MFYEGFEIGRRLLWEMPYYNVERMFAIFDAFGGRTLSQDFMSGFKAALDIKAGRDTDSAKKAKDRGLSL